MTKKVVVLGGTGMLGAMVTDVFAQARDMEVAATRRDSARGTLAGAAVEWRALDAAVADVAACRPVLAGSDWAINCIGITKPLITDTDPAKVENAVRVNSLFPHILANAAAAEHVHVLQIATDCVYSGAKGCYVESDAHDALDVYGKTKSLGEVNAPMMHHLRASIIGPEPKDHKFLLDWFLRQPQAASVNGFTNHDWNGVTTLHFARVALGMVRAERPWPVLQHLVPSGAATKAAMLEAFAHSYGRGDVKINRVAAGIVIDRTLATKDESTNRALWDAAGYRQPPTVEKMIGELAQHATVLARSAA